MLKPAGGWLYNRVNNEDRDLGFHVSPEFKVSAGMVGALHLLPRALHRSWSRAAGARAEQCLWQVPVAPDE